MANQKSYLDTLWANSWTLELLLDFLCNNSNCSEFERGYYRILEKILILAKINH